MSAEEIQVYRDDLLGMTWSEFQASSFFQNPPDGWLGTPFWDVGAITSVFVQAIQKFYRFRPLQYQNFLRDADEYEALRAYMREGSLIGNTFAGPTLFSSSGANAGRSPSTMQVGGDGEAKLVFPADIAVAGFVFPAPGAASCPFNFYREYRSSTCPLCEHECLHCHNGSEWIQTEVCGCSSGFWALQIEVGEGCHQCPARAVCDGRDTLPYPQANAWGDAANPVDFFECKSQRCRGGPQFECEDGFAGHMCEGTQQGWFSLGSGLRLKCPQGQTAQGLLHAALIGAVLLIFFTLNRVLASRFDSIDLFLDSMQRLAIVSNFWLRWPEQFAALFTLLEIVLLDADLARPDCVMSWNFWYSFWVQKLLLFLLFATIVLPVLVSSLRLKLRHSLTWTEVLTDDKFNAKPLNSAISKCIDTLLMMYPTLAKNTFDTFTCRELNGQHYLVADPNFQCYTADHTEMVVVSALLQPLLVFALPFGSLYLLVRGTKNQTLHEEQNLQRYGVLFARYEPPYLWWEGWRIVQKLLLVGIQVLLWQFPLLQANMALLLFLLGLASHYYAQPYASPVLDGMDSASYFFSCLFTMVGISFYSDDFQWREGLYACTLAGLGLYALVAVFMSYFDVAERVASKKAEAKVRLAAKQHFTRLQTEASEHPGCENARLRRMRTSASLGKLLKEADEGLQELPSTLDGHLFKRWTDSEEVSLEAYHRLKEIDGWLAPYVSDQSPTSQFSLLPEAEFFRQINLVFPNFYTWIRHASPEDMEALKRVFGSILKHAAEEDEGFQAAIVPGDQSSVLYWLINVAEPSQRETLFSMLELLISAQPVSRWASASDVESNLFTSLRNGFTSQKKGSSTPQHAAASDFASRPPPHPAAPDADAVSEFAVQGPPATVPLEASGGTASSTAAEPVKRRSLMLDALAHEDADCNALQGRPGSEHPPAAPSSHSVGAGALSVPGTADESEETGESHAA